MRRASVVIGAGYGDEGKGLVTSTLANKHDLVVRFSGGSQAAHRVEYNDLKHTFHHFSSGTLQKVPTYLSKYFILNPIFFREELQELHSMDVNPQVFAHWKCPITTPFDMLINQHLEMRRGEDRHGSCGAGINETITRNNEHELTLDKAYLGLESIKERLMYLFDVYYAKRADILELDIKYFKDKELLNSLLENFIRDFVFMANRITLVDDDILEEYDDVLFEGSQGLLLDEEYGTFPHVTRGRTGVHNVKKIIGNKDIPVSAFYVTRHYMTRHGAGPLEYTFLPHGNVRDLTNEDNVWQGAIRYGFLDVPLLKHTVEKDTCKRFRSHLVVTCMDQNFYGNNMFIGEKGIIERMKKKPFLRMLNKKLKMPVFFTDSPKTRNNLKRLK
jgi:adenylosuccinate synthase